jgi:cysteine sulfinate desulfinase/cysteine desulfurase-like protein/rhodanese-related sulfurtransferase
MELREEARTRVAQLLGCADSEVVFTSGATESLHTAIFSALMDAAERSRAGRLGAAPQQVLYGATEHKAVPEALRHWFDVLDLPFACRAIPVDRHGQYDAAFLESELPRSLLVCTMAVNNETGVIQDLGAVSRIISRCRSGLCYSGQGPLWVVDAVQGIGKIDVALCQRPIDYLAFTGHKLHAPKGIGVLVVRPGAPFRPLFVGGGQEQGRRAGTEPLPALAGFSEVLRALADANQGSAYSTRAELNPPHVQLAQRERLWRAIAGSLAGASPTVPFESCVPTTLSFSVPGLTSLEIGLLLESHGVFVSSGSACQSAKAGFSHVLEAMGCEPWRMTSATRLSFGLATPDADIDRGVDRIAAVKGSLAQSWRAAGPLMRLTNGLSSALVVVDPAKRCMGVLGPREVFAHRLSERAQAWGVDAPWQEDLHAVTAGDGLWSMAELGEGRAAGAPLPLVLRQKSTPGAPALVVVYTRAELTEDLISKVTHESHGESHGLALGFVCDDRSPVAGYPCVLRNKAHRAVGQEGVLWADPQADEVVLALPDLVARVAGQSLRLIDVREHYEHSPWSPFATVLEGVQDWLAAHTVASKGTQGILGLEVLRKPTSELCAFLLEVMAEGPSQQVCYAFLCRSGRRAERAARLMRHLGFANSWSVQGGAASVLSLLQKSA